MLGHALAARAAPHSPSRELPKASTGVARCPIIPDHLPRSVHDVARYTGVWYRDRYPLLARVLAHVMSRLVFAPVLTSDRHLLARGVRTVEPEDTVALGLVQSRSHLRGDHRRDLGESAADRRRLISKLHRKDGVQYTPTLWPFIGGDTPSSSSLRLMLLRVSPHSRARRCAVRCASLPQPRHKRLRSHRT